MGTHIGTVLKLLETEAIVMTDKSDFIAVKKRPQMYIGQQIQFDEADIQGLRRHIISKMVKVLSLTAAGAAVFILIFLYFRFSYQNTVYAFIDVDINPSMEFAINRQGVIVDIRAINKDGEKLLKGLKLKNNSIEIALEQLIKKSKEEGYISGKESTVLIAASLNTRTAAGKGQDSQEVYFDSLLLSYKKNISFYDESLLPVIIKVSPKLKSLAERRGMSMGRQAVYVKAKELGIDMTMEEVRSSKVVSILNRLGSGSNSFVTYNREEALKSGIGIDIIRGFDEDTLDDKTDYVVKEILSDRENKGAKPSENSTPVPVPSLDIQAGMPLADSTPMPLVSPLPSPVLPTGTVNTAGPSRAPVKADRQNEAKDDAIYKEVQKAINLLDSLNSRTQEAIRLETDSANKKIEEINNSSLGESYKKMLINNIYDELNFKIGQINKRAKVQEAAINKELDDAIERIIGEE
ncbi:MAG: anti-sigma factor domain-containing protein [Bacillota bacterium]